MIQPDDQRTMQGRLGSKVEQGGLNGGHDMDAGAQVEGLETSDIVLDVLIEPVADPGQEACPEL